MLHMISVGLEHFQTGLEIQADGNVVVERDGPTTFVLLSLQPFKTFWRRINSNTGDQDRLEMFSVEVKREFATPWTTTLIRERIEHNSILSGGNVLNGMSVILRTKDAVYLRMPQKLWEPITCDCETCKRNNRRGYWDTLVVATKRDPKKNDYAWTCHMPPETIGQHYEYWKSKRMLAE